MASSDDTNKDDTKRNVVGRAIAAFRKGTDSEPTNDSPNITRTPAADAASSATEEVVKPDTAATPEPETPKAKLKPRGGRGIDSKTMVIDKSNLPNVEDLEDLDKIDALGGKTADADAEAVVDEPAAEEPAEDTTADDSATESEAESDAPEVDATEIETADVEAADDVDGDVDDSVEEEVDEASTKDAAKVAAATAAAGAAAVAAAAAAKSTDSETADEEAADSEADESAADVETTEVSDEPAPVVDEDAESETDEADEPAAEAESESDDTDVDTDVDVDEASADADVETPDVETPDVETPDADADTDVDSEAPTVAFAKPDVKASSDANSDADDTETAVIRKPDIRKLEPSTTTIDKPAGAAAATAAATATAATAAAASKADTKPVEHEPQVIPAAPEVKKKRNWRPIAAIAAAAILIIGGVAAYLFLRPAAEADKAADVAVSYVDAQNNGDIGTLRSVTCGARHDYYARVSDADFAKYFQSQKARNELVNISGVKAAKVTGGDSAVVEVNAYRTGSPQSISAVSINLQKQGGDWKVCDPQ